MNILVQSTTQNKKTGNIPTIIVGQSYDEITSSCRASGCILLHKKLGGNGGYKELGLLPCYAHKGHVSWGTKSILRAIDKGTRTVNDYSIKEGFSNSSRNARYFRLSSIGDASSLSHETINELVTEGEKYNLKPLGYTASKEATHLKEVCLLSCPTIEETDEAISKGWRATTITNPKNWDGKRTFKTPKGFSGIYCPEQVQAIKAKADGVKVTPRTKITCNTCGLCSQGNKHTTRYKAIGFFSHG